MDELISRLLPNGGRLPELTITTVPAASTTSTEGPQTSDSRTRKRRRKGTPTKKVAKVEEEEIGEGEGNELKGMDEKIRIKHFNREGEEVLNVRNRLSLAIPFIHTDCPHKNSILWKKCSKRVF